VDQLSVEKSRAWIQGSSIPSGTGEMLVDFRRSNNPLPRYSFGELLQDRKVPSEVAGKLVWWVSIWTIHPE